MDWDTPPRTKALGAAALLAAVAALWPVRQGCLPLLNASLGPLAASSALRSQTLHAPIEVLASDDDVRKKTGLAAVEEWRDALAAPAGMPLATVMESSGGGWRPPRWGIDPAKKTKKKFGVAEEETLLPRTTKPSLPRQAPAAGTQAIAPAASVRPPVERSNFSFFPGPQRPGSRRRRVMIQDFSKPDRELEGRPPRLKTASTRARPQESRAISGLKRDAKVDKTSRRRRAAFRPLLLSALLGKNAIRPPQGDIPVPNLSALAQRLPKTGPDGRSWKPAAAQATHVESWRPPQRPLTECRKTKGHWHQASGSWLYHDDKAWAATEEGRLGWMARQGGRWWAWTAEPEPTWLSHQGRWWWKSEGVWFLLHQAQAWAYRLFLDGRAEGLFHPGTGTSMVYSQDGGRVAVVTPGAGAVLFDALTGREIRRWSEDELKTPKKPPTPSALTFPP